MQRASAAVAVQSTPGSASTVRERGECVEVRGSGSGWCSGPQLGCPEEPALPSVLGPLCSASHAYTFILLCMFLSVHAHVRVVCVCVVCVCACACACVTLPPHLQGPPSSSAHFEQHHRQQQGTTPSSSLLPIPSLLGQSATMSLSPTSRGTVGGKSEPLSAKGVPPSPLHHALTVTPSEAALAQQQQQTVRGGVG